MAAPTLADIKINGKPYRIALESWRSKDLADFSPRASTPGGSVQQSELLLYQPLEQTDWRHGFGFFWLTDAMGYTQTTGDIDTRRGTVMLHTATTTVTDSGSNTAKTKMFLFGSDMYSIGSAGLRKYVEGTGVWSSIYSTAAVNDAIASDGYIFYAPDGVRIRKNNGTTDSEAGVDADATDYKWLCMHKGFIYAGKDGTNQVYYDDSADLSNLHGTPASDTNEIYVGFAGIPTLGAISYGGYLYVAKRDGLYQIGDDKIARKVLDFSTDGNASNNFATMEVYNGYLYFVCARNLYQWNGARLVIMTPPGLTDVYPYNTFLYIRNLKAIGGYLYCTGSYQIASGNYSHALLCFDGVGWHKIHDILSDQSAYYAVYLGLNHSASNIRLYINYYNPTTYITEYIRLSANAMPYPSFPTTGTHYLETSRLDMGYRRIDKSTPSILIEAGNMSTASSDGTDIAVDYSLNGAAYVHWGHAVADGVTELTLPGSNNTVEYKYIKLKFTLSTLLATRTPILEGYTLRFLMRPDTYYGWNFSILASKDIEYDGHGQKKSPAEIKAELEAVRASKSPVELVDIWGSSHYGYISSITEQAVERHEDELGESPNIEAVYSINFVEVR